jgi:hypothetical protein
MTIGPPSTGIVADFDNYGHSIEIDANIDVFDSIFDI